MELAEVKIIQKETLEETLAKFFIREKSFGKMTTRSLADQSMFIKI